MSQWHRDAELSLIKRLELAEESRARGFMTEPHLIRLMIETLRWYADKGNYDDGCPGDLGDDGRVQVMDNGSRARVALISVERSKA